ncbi:MAG: BrnT family toxin [Wenzhouxiangellaceae bacterium]|nr:BrnT family toxin [Wenzhouxiangellaceae bacterium]
MKTFAWDAQKNDWLIKVRNISFERIVHVIEHEGLLDVVSHHNRSRYPEQQIFVVQVDQYAYLVPFVETERHYFLKTIIPSRKATRQYLESRNEPAPKPDQ